VIVQLSKTAFEPEDNLPSKDHFYKTNTIFNHLFKKSVKLTEAQTSKTNTTGIIWVNFAQADTRMVLRDLGGSEWLLDCGHVISTRLGGRSLSVGSDATCLRCGSNGAYRNFEHEWSHIIFGSAPAANEKFVRRFCSLLRNRADEGLLVGFSDMLKQVVEVFDDIRVNSLWQISYPGSANEIEERWRTTCKETTNLPQNFPVWVLGVAVDAPNLGTRGPFAKLYGLAKQATDAVRGRDLQNMFVVVRWFIEQCLDRLLDPTPPQEQPQGQEQEKPNTQPSKKTKKDGKQELPSDLQTPETTRDILPKSLPEAAQWLSAKSSSPKTGQEHHTPSFTEETSQSARYSPSDIDKAFSQACEYGKPLMQMLDSSGKPLAAVDEGVRQAVSALQKATGQEATSNQFLLADTLDKVLVADILPSHIDPKSKIIIDEDDEASIDRMRAIFAKFIGKRVTRRSSDGDEIDVQALIRYHLEGEEEELFEDEGFTKGFAYMTLCDMSDSMSGQPFADVCKGSEMLKQALDYPFVIPHLWGFRGAEMDAAQAATYVLPQQRLQVLTRGGESWIYKYHRDCEGFLGAEVVGYGHDRSSAIPIKCGGLTPMNTGLHIASKYMATHVPSGMDKKIFLLTDGAPTQFHSSGLEVSSETMLRLVRQEVNQARNRGVHIYPIVIGNTVTDDMATTMFGPAVFWKRATTKTIGETLMTIVLRDFVRYLKR
jgi:hypothetical protein